MPVCRRGRGNRGAIFTVTQAMLNYNYSAHCTGFKRGESQGIYNYFSILSVFLIHGVLLFALGRW